MSIVVVSGANGFIGQKLCLDLAQAGHTVRALSRQKITNSNHENIEWSKVSYGDRAQMCSVFKGSDCLVHLADDPNRLSKEEPAANPTELISLAMAEAGLKRIVFSSSIYARLNSENNPSPYGQHKLGSETALLAYQHISPVILRLPPVYGPGGKGGLALLTKLIQKGIPLPLGMAKEKRDYISRANLANLITHLVELNDKQWEIISGLIFEPSDGHPISGVDLCKALANAVDKKAIMLPVPYGLLSFAAKIIRKDALVSSVFNEMKVKSAPNLKALSNWEPIEKIPHSLNYLSLR
jgi:UDP-glucose 4-epimerase